MSGDRPVLSADERKAVLSGAVAWWLAKSGRWQVEQRSDFQVIVTNGRSARAVFAVDEHGDVTQQTLPIDRRVPVPSRRGLLWKSDYFQIRANGTLVRRRLFGLDQTPVASLSDAQSVVLRLGEADVSVAGTFGAATRRVYSVRLELSLGNHDPMRLLMSRGFSRRRRDRLADRLESALRVVVPPERFTRTDHLEAW